MMHKLLFVLLTLIFISCNTKTDDQESTYRNRSADTSSVESSGLLIEKADTMVEFKSNFFIHKYPSSWIADAATEPGGATIFHAHIGDTPAETISLNTMVLIKPKEQSLLDFASETVNIKFKANGAKQGISQQISEKPYGIVKSIKNMGDQQYIMLFYFIEIDKTHIVTEMFYGRLTSISRQKKNIDKIYQSVTKSN